MKRKLFRGLLLWLLLCMMIVPASLAEEEIIGYGELQLYSEGAFPAPPAERPAMFSARTKTVQQTIYDGLMAQEEKINIYAYGILIEDIQSIFQDIINNEPDLFFIDSYFRYSNYVGEDIVLSLIPTYKYTGAELESEMAAYNSAVNAIVKDAKKANTTVGQLLRANEYLCLNFEYDTSYSIYKPNEFFKQGKGVCNAYMLAYKAVLDRLDINSSAVVFPDPNPNDGVSEGHIWNIVNIEDNWYHIDVTWNDPVKDEKLFARHNNFLRSDDGIESTGHHDWISNYNASSKKYDNKPWVDLDVPLSVIKDKVYYNTRDKFVATLHYYDLEDDSITDLYTYNINSYWDSGVPCSSNGVRIYLSTGHDVYSVDMNGEDYRLEYIGDPDFIIKNMVVKGDQLSMLVKAESIEKVITITVDVPLTMTISPAEMTMQPGETMALNVSIEPEPEEMPVLTYESSQPLVISFDEDGVMTAGVPGQATVTAKYSETIFASGVVTVHREDAAILPANTREIRDGAFSGMPVVEFILPEGVEEIGSGAFADCDNLLYINLPDSLTDVAEDAFDEDSGVTLIVTSGAYAQEFAESSGLKTAVLNPAVTETTETTEAEETADK